MSCEELATANEGSAARLVALAVSVALGAAAAAHAQEARELPKISVDEKPADPYKVEQSASRKYTAPLRDIPQTLTVIPRAVFREQGATTLRDVLRNTPGLTFQAGEGGGGLPGDQNFTMRGFSARNSLYFDGVRDTGAYTRDAFNLEQVEVAKGPVAALAGRSASAGAINQITKTPKAESFQDFELALGSEQYKRATADVNQSLGNGKAARLNVLYHDTDVAGRDVVENERWGVAPSFAWGLDTGTRLTLGFLYLEEDNVPDYGLPWGSYTQNGVTYPTGAFNADPPIDQSLFYGLRDYDFEAIESKVGTLQVEHDFSDALTLQNTLRYVDTDRESAITAPRPPNRQLQQRAMGFENFTNHTNLKLTLNSGALSHSVTTGLEISRETTNNRNSAQSTNQPQVTNFFAPNPDDRPLGPLPAITGDPSEATVDTVGLYAFDTITLNPKWQITAGLRWDQVDVDYEQTRFATGAVLTDLSSDESLVSWQAGVVYKPIEIASVYFGYGTAFDPSVDAATTGAALSTTPTSANNINLDPEKSRNFELGTKWDLAEGRLLLTGALFRTEKTNARTRNSNNEPFILTGEQVVDGVELTATGSLTDNWSLFGGYAFLDSEIEKSANPVEESQALLLTPKHSFNAWSTYRLGPLTLGAGAQFLDNVTRARTATSETVLPSYWLFDAMASYQVNDMLTVRVNGTNLADKEYVDRVGGGHYIPGPGRSGWLTAAFTF
jgi:catecholate siderophore receptor